MIEETLKKADIHKSSIVFKDEILLNDNRISTLIELGKKNKFEEKKELRPIAWKIFLGIIPEDNNKSIEEWIDIIDSQRKEYKQKLEKIISLKSIKNYKSIDPLLINENKQNDDNDKAVINLINLDLERTHQAIELFQKKKTKTILSNILFIYSKENEDIPYGQGMNELISMLFICLYPYYFPYNDNKGKIEKDEIQKCLNDIEAHYEDIYYFFHNEDELESDLFFLFKSLMLKGIKNLYGKDDIPKDDINYKLYELFPDMIKDSTDDERPTHLNLRSYMIVKEKIKIIDKKLYNHFKNININCNYFLHRWFRCIFAREFDINEVLCLWDKIFLYEFENNKKYKYPLVYIDFICVSMIIRIRNQLIKKDEGDCFTILFHYPKGENIFDIIEITDQICKTMENKLNKEEYNLNYIFDLIKDNDDLIDDNNNNNGDVNEELIITPHMYNQNNNKGLIDCDKKKENIIFCGKYYFKNKYIFVILLLLILFCLLIWVYNYIQLDNK